MRRIFFLNEANTVYLSPYRFPKYKILLFDNSDSISNIVLGNYSQTPKNITKYVDSFSVEESSEGASSGSLEICFVAEECTPLLFLDRKYIKIFVSDTRLLSNSSQYWIQIFFGTVTGQPAFKTRIRDEIKKFQISLVDREFFHNKQKIVTETFSEGTDFGDMSISIAQTHMFLLREEIEWGTQDYEVKHSIVSFAEETVFDIFNYIFFILDKKVYFNGEGKLSLRNTSITKSPFRIYSSLDLIQNFGWTSNSLDLNNTVKVIGLENQITKITYPRQVLIEAKGTVGFFEDQHTQKLYYSEDRTQAAEDPLVDSFTINGWVSNFLSGNMRVQSSGEYACKLVIITPYNAWVFIGFLVGYIAIFAMHAIFGGFLGGLDLIAAAIWLTAGLMIMQQLGNFQASISAIPYTYVYKEIEEVAQWGIVEEWEERSISFENHLIHTNELAKTLAFRELNRETFKGQSREFILLDDPLMEADDIVEFPDSSKYYITSISRTYSREGVPTMNVQGFLIEKGSYEFA